MPWKQPGSVASSGQPIKNGKWVAELLEAIQQPRQLAIIKMSGHSEVATMEAKGNNLADAAAKQATLNSQIVQTRECFLLNQQKTLFDRFNGQPQEKRSGYGKKKKGKLRPKQTDMAWMQSETNLTYRGSVTYTSCP